MLCTAIFFCHYIYIPFRYPLLCGGGTRAIGSFDKLANDNVKVAFISKHRGTDIPYLGFRVQLRRDPATKDLFKDTEMHPVFCKYTLANHSIEHRKPSLQEITMLLNLNDNAPSVQQLIDQGKLYCVILGRQGRDGVEVTEHGSSFRAIDTATKDIYNHMSSIADGEVTVVFLAEFDNLAHYIDYNLEQQRQVTNPLAPYYHPLKKSDRP